MSGSDQDGGRSPKRRRTSTNEGASSSRASAEESSVEEKVAKPVAVVVPVKREAVAETRGDERNAQIRRIEDGLEEVVRNLLRRRLGDVLRSMPVSEVMGMLKDEVGSSSGRRQRSSSSSIEVLPEDTNEIDDVAND